MPAPKDLLERIHLRLEESFVGIGEQVADLPAVDVADLINQLTLIEAATDLSAKPWKAFWEVTLPLTLPGVVTGALLVFIPMTGEYIIPDILSGGKYEFVGNVIGDTFLEAQNRPFGSALAISLMLAGPTAIGCSTPATTIPGSPATVIVNRRGVSSVFINCNR